MEKQFYSIADIKIEFWDFPFRYSRLEVFRETRPGKTDIIYRLKKKQKFSDFEMGNLIYENSRFSEYEDENIICRVHSIQCLDGKKLVVLKKEKNQPKILEVQVEHGLYDKYGACFDFFNHLAFETVLLSYQGFVLHSSVISYRNSGILFTASSGTGKSTQADLWNKYKNAEIINGDRAMIRKVEEAYWAYGSPVAGSSGIFKNEKVKIKAIIVLSQSKENRIRRMDRRESFVYLLQQTLINEWDREYTSKVTDLLLDITSEIPIYSLACRPDLEAVELVESTVFAK